MNPALELTLALELTDVQKHFGGHDVLRGVTLSVPKGQVRAIIGPNGAGKTTLINVITGIHPPSAGAIHLDDADITRMPPHRIARRGLSRTFQIASLFLDLTVIENVRVAAHAATRFRPSAAPAEGNLELAGITPLAHRLASEISHGDQRLLEIAVALASNPVLLLLDEPTAGMSPAETHRFIEIVNRHLRHRTTLVIVEHDMHVVMNTADVISVLTMGTILAEGPPRPDQGRLRRPGGLPWQRLRLRGCTATTARPTSSATSA